MRNLFPRLVLGIPLIACFVGLGCGGTNKNIPASLSGSVNYNGAPVTGGNLMLYPKDGGGFNRIPISGDGTFSYKELPIGEMIVTVETESINPNVKMPEYKGGKSKAGGPPGMGGSAPGGKAMQSSPMPSGANASKSGGATYVKIPAHYASQEKSPLRTTLKAGENKETFELTDK